MSNNRKIILFPNAQRDIGFEMARHVGEMVTKRGRSAVYCPVFEDDTTAHTLPPGIETVAVEDVLAQAEMIITFGGDGTILRAARVATDMEVPILGVNLGGKGFIAELEAEEVELIDKALTDGFGIENRMMLDAEVVRGDNTICRDFALNDIVIKGDNKVIEMVLFGDEQMISRFSGDGAVISTPTGSTAYAMAAGGPIVEPAAQNIIVTPICAHTLEAKSFVLVSDRRVSVEIGYRKHNPAYMSVDGGEHFSIQGGDVINVRKSEKSAKLVRITKRSFYQKVSKKLGERP